MRRSIGKDDEWSDEAHERYTSHFGPQNQVVDIANHTFVLLDAPGLVEEDHARYISGMSFARWAATNPRGPIAFAQQAAEIARASLRSTSPMSYSRALLLGSNGQPTVLLTHIPLARSASASCGPLRELGSIRAGVGFGYSNTLSNALSDMLLTRLRPSAIFRSERLLHSRTSANRNNRVQCR